MLEKFKSILIDITELPPEKQRLASLIFLAIAGGMSFLEYTHIGWIWDRHLSFAPGLISTIIAALMIAPLYLRGILIWNKSVYTAISFVLILLVFASFVELAMGGNSSNQYVRGAIGAALLLSWLGIKEVAGGCWALALLAGLSSAILNNMIMGFYGFTYIACGVLGQLFHSGLNPGQLVTGIRSAY